MNMIASSGQLRASYIRWALFLVPAIVLLGVLSSYIAGSGPENPWFASLEKPAIFPSASLFSGIWTAQYALMGFALALVLSARGAWGRGIALTVFILQLILNLAWPSVLYGMHQISWAFALIGVLCLTVLVTTVLFWRVRLLAGLLMLPYLVWIGFATYLTWELREANAELEGQEVSGAVQRF